MDTRERIVLYVIVLALAIAVVFLALTGNGGGCPDCGGLDQRLVAIDGAIGRLETRVTDAVGEVVDGVVASTSTHERHVTTAHDEMAARLDDIEGGLARLECRVAELCPMPGKRDWDDSKCGAAGGCDFTP